MRIVLADDHALFKDALVRYIARLDEAVQITEASDMRDVMNVLETGEEQPDLVLLDLRMPGMNGLRGLRTMRDHYPDLKVALMSGLADKGDVEEALSLGACGYFPKTLSGKGMMKGIYQVLSGERFVPIDHNSNDIMPAYYDEGGVAGLDALARAPDMPPSASLSLTPREQDVAQYLLRGASNKEIARALDIQVVTVKLHVRSLCRKLGAKNRTQAALFAQQIGVGKEEYHA